MSGEVTRSYRSQTLVRVDGFCVVCKQPLKGLYMVTSKGAVCVNPCLEKFDSVKDQLPDAYEYREEKLVITMPEKPVEEPPVVSTVTPAVKTERRTRGNQLFADPVSLRMACMGLDSSNCDDLKEFVRSYHLWEG